MISSISYNINCAWQCFSTNGTWANSTQNDSLSFNLGSINVSTFNQVFAHTFSLASSAYDELDLTALNDFLGNSFGFLHVLTLMVQPSGSEVTVAPGTTNGLQWFFGTSSSVLVPDGGQLAFSAKASASGAAISGTHKTIRFTNSGVSPLSLDVVIIGSTT